VPETAVSNTRSTLTALLVVIASIAVTLISIEAVFRIAGIEPIPHVEKEHIKYEVNSNGLRDHEYHYDKADDVFRIVATGDSFTYGTGVCKLDDIFLKRLERALNAGSPGEYRFEVINGAQPGYNTPEEYQWLKKEGVRYSPDLIMVIYFFNDATYMGTVTSLMRPIHEEAAKESGGKSVLYSYLKYRMMRRLVSHRTMEEYRQAYFEGKGGMTKSGLWEKCKESILGIKQLAEAHDAGLLFVIFPILIDLDDDYAFRDIHDIVVDFITQNGIEVHSLLPDFVEYDGKPESLWVNIVNAHPNELGHEIAAQSLTTYLLNSGLLARRGQPGRLSIRGK
jgi:hypothetical protein